jgi:putative addiction module killer protein
MDENRRVYTVEHYVTRGGKDVFMAWHGQIRDQRAQLAIDRRVTRIAEGNLGDHKSCGNGIWELRIDFGPGFRVYYVMEGERIVLLLCGGNKSTQQGDIQRASAYWEDWKERSHEK